jgi:hypothetical protein
MAGREPRVSISHWAYKFICEQGGAVYLWTNPAEGGFVTVSASASRPPDVRFQNGRTREGVLVFAEEGFVTEHIKVGLRRLPRAKLVAHTEGLGGD